MLTLRKTSSLALTLAAAACVISACSSSSNPPSPMAEGGSSGGSTSSGSSSGGTCSGDGGNVPTNVTFDDAGKPTCAAGVGCDLTTNVCCVSSTGGVCNSKAKGCLPGQGNFGCVDDSTCPSGQVCCFQADQGAQTAGSSCQTVAAGAKCSPDITATAGSVQLCQTTSECKSGCCAWQDCTIMSSTGTARTLSLTMCGAPPTSSSIFTCAAH
jgi:hypothetical protein